jgi:DNA topoisomerase 2-associated protein PAT1
VARASTAAPRPVLAVPMAKGVDRRVPQLNQDAGIRRQALTRNQVLISVEGLYDTMLELEQMRRGIPPPTATEQLEAWNAACQMKSDEIWRKLMVMEPLDVR